MRLSTIANCEEITPGIASDEAKAAIRRSAEYELLVDQPHENDNTVRVAGPFTVESLSPHRTVETAPAAAVAETDFAEMVLDNLIKAGVQNGYRKERLDLGWIKPFAGTRVKPW